MKSCHKLSKNCSIHGKNHEIFGPYNFWTPVKTIALMFETETVGPFLVRKLKWGGHGLRGSPSGYAPVSVLLIYFWWPKMFPEKYQETLSPSSSRMECSKKMCLLKISKIFTCAGDSCLIKLETNSLFYQPLLTTACPSFTLLPFFIWGIIWILKNVLNELKDYSK